MRRCLAAQTRFAVDAGIDHVQVREPDLAAAEIAAIVVELVELARGSRTRVLVNDRLDVALACGADGVHLRANSVAPKAARAIAPPGFLIGKSVHSVAEAVSAADADYLIAGAVWPTESKPDDYPLLGLDGLQAIVSSVAVPVLAIGGVDRSRLSQVSKAGAVGVAGIGLFLDPHPGPGRCRAMALGDLADAARTG